MKKVFGEASVSLFKHVINVIALKEMRVTVAAFKETIYFGKRNCVVNTERLYESD